MRLSIVLLLCVLASSIHAQQVYPVQFPVSQLSPTLSPTQTTSLPIPCWINGQPGYGGNISLDWNLPGVTSGSTATAVILQSNSPDGPFVAYNSTSPGGATNPHSTITINAQTDGTDTVLAHSAYIEVQLTDTGNTTITGLTMRALVR